VHTHNNCQETWRIAEEMLNMSNDCFKDSEILINDVKADKFSFRLREGRK
jgi:hypothetical protein